jgi:hypothetical protein
MHKLQNLKVMKTIKMILIYGLLSLTVHFTMAQNNMQDAVYLKNGGITRGNLIEMVPDDHISIETVDGNIFVYKMSEVEKYTKEPIYEKKKSVIQDNTGNKKGYYGVVEFGTGFCFGHETRNFDRKINFISGYRVNPWFAAGAGFGIRYYHDDGLMMPFFADLRANLLNKRTSPYLSLDIGYAFNPTDVTVGGFMTAPTIGVSVKVKNRSTLNFGLCYELQKSVYYEVYYRPYNYSDNNYSYVPPTYSEIKRQCSFHSVSFLFGVSF